ncbi:MAG: PLP-dependent aspartate aminotransferase family protein [Reichenbachiella sp.]|uniref:trans-sulfuration enzyme family protein n=1 Tax=Reichenbachiella sp. TaxID=2184521 RepID=UPI0032653E85
MKKSFFTKSVHAGVDLSNHQGSISTPIYSASTFAFPNAEQGAAIHEGEMPGYFYSRINNPTQEALEAALADLENGEAAIAFSSGMAAISNGLLTILKKGDHMIAPESIYASTSGLLNYLDASLGIETTFVDATQPLSYKESIKPNTKLLYLESPANPTLKLCDMEAIVDVAKNNGILTVMDNTFATPYNQRPLEYGVDAVVHSMTKYIGGHADLLAGAMVGSKELVEKCRWNTNKIFGGVPSAQTSWLAHRGIKTLALRMERHNENALAVANFLESHPKVVKVHYPGLATHAQHELARKQMKGFGGMISFEVNGADAGRKLVNSLNLCTLAVSLGDVSTIIQHSASMTHASVPSELREKAGITDGLLRLSVGIEDKNDIIEDLKTGLNAL